MESAELDKLKTLALYHPVRKTREAAGFRFVESYGPGLGIEGLIDIAWCKGLPGSVRRAAGVKAAEMCIESDCILNCFICGNGVPKGVRKAADAAVLAWVEKRAAKGEYDALVELSRGRRLRRKVRNAVLRAVEPACLNAFSFGSDGPESSILVSAHIHLKKFARLSADRGLQPEMRKAVKRALQPASLKIICLDSAGWYWYPSLLALASWKVLPMRVREEAGMRLVGQRLRERNFNALKSMSMNQGLPWGVQDAAFCALESFGLELVKKHAAYAEVGKLCDLAQDASWPGPVHAAARAALRTAAERLAPKNPLAGDGTMSRGTVNPPARPPETKPAGRRAAI